MKTPYTKSEALYFKEENIRFSYDKDMMNTMYQFLIDIGAKGELPSNKNELQSYLIRLHETLTVNNPMFGGSINFYDVYPKWMMDVVYGKIKRYGNNISALVGCFNDWYKVNAINYLEKPKQEQSEGTRLEFWDDEKIKSSYEAIQKIGGTQFGNLSLFNTSKANSYFNRVKNEYNKRFNE